MPIKDPEKRKKYNKWREANKGKIFITLNTAKKKVSLAIDHNHATKRARGLLCARCNRGISHFSENILYLQGAIVPYSLFV